MSDSFATPWTVAYQVPLSMGFPRWEYWSGLPFPPPGDLPNPGIKLEAPALASGFSTTEPCGKPIIMSIKKESKVAQSCPTLCNPMDCSLPVSSIHGIFQARVLEWVAISFSRGSSQPRDWAQVSCIAGRRFIIWATREAQIMSMLLLLLLLPTHFSHVRLCATP